MKLESYDSTDQKRRYKIVRTDFGGPNGGDVDGEIIAADEVTGETCLQVAGETRTFSFGPHGIRIVRRSR